MSSLLSLLWDRIQDHARTFDARPIPVFLGDLIDRGQGNIEVMDMVSSVVAAHPDSQLILGNHDEYFLKFLTGNLDQRARQLWYTYGGLETIRSYGIDLNADEAFETTKIKTEYPHHFDLLRSAVSNVILDQFILVHAGIRPGVPLSEQDPQDMRWIREPFLSSTDTFEKIVVHGHTITDSGLPEVFQNRIAIDTGSYRNNRLSAMAIFDTDATQPTRYEFLIVDE